MSQQADKSDPGKKHPANADPSAASLWTAAGLFVASALLYFADTALSSAGVWVPDWREYFINRGLYLIAFAVPFLYCSYIYRVRGVVASILVLTAFFCIRLAYSYPDTLPFFMSVTFTLFITVLGFLIARYQNIRDKEKEAVRQVEASERRYRALTENVADFIWLMDLNMDLHYVYVDPAGTQMLGYTVEEAMKQKIDDILSPDSIEQTLEVIKKELAATDRYPETDPYHVRVLRLSEKHRDGTLLPVEVKIIFVRDRAGKPTEILGVTRLLKKRLSKE